VVAVTHFHEDHGWLGAVPGAPAVVDRTTTARGVRFRTVTSAHDDRGGARMGLSRSVRCRIDGVTVLHTGDLGDFDSRWLRAHRGVDLLLLPVGGVYTLPPQRAADLLEALSPRWCVPMHYASDAVALPMGTREAFLPLLAPGTRVSPVVNPVDFDVAPPRGVLLLDPLPADAVVR
jgi:L-ascorbate metabolism protein UlaG (beta-lactamase superfamily)